MYKKNVRIIRVKDSYAYAILLEPSDDISMEILIEVLHKVQKEFQQRCINIHGSWYNSGHYIKILFSEGLNKFSNKKKAFDLKTAQLVRALTCFYITEILSDIKKQEVFAKWEWQNWDDSEVIDNLLDYLNENN